MCCAKSSGYRAALHVARQIYADAIRQLGCGDQPDSLSFAITEADRVEVTLEPGGSTTTLSAGQDAIQTIRELLQLDSDRIEFRPKICAGELHFGFFNPNMPAVTAEAAA